MDSDEQPGSRLGEDLRRMFLERGFDFFNQDEEQRQAHKPADDEEAAPQSKDIVNQPSDSQTTETTSPEALSNMRLEILPQLQYVRDSQSTYPPLEAPQHCTWRDDPRQGCPFPIRSLYCPCKPSLHSTCGPVISPRASKRPTCLLFGITATFDSVRAVLQCASCSRGKGRGSEKSF
jgi:hypothetical protein